MKRSGKGAGMVFRLDVVEIMKMIQSPPFNFKVREFEVVESSDEPVFFLVSFDRVDPYARRALERALTKKGFEVQGGGTELAPGGASDISFTFKKP